MFPRSATPIGPRRTGASRRDFLTVGSAGLAGLTLPGLLRARDTAARSGSLSKSTSVVWLWLAGGPSQIETFDPKPDAPVEFRSVTGSVDTNLPGVRLGGTFPLIAKAADKFAFVRSFAHSDSGHGGGTHHVMTGYDYPAADNGAAPTRPGLGAILSRHRGATTESGIPTYIRSREILADGPAWLGRAYGPLDVAGPARANMRLRDTPDALADRRALLNAFDKIDRDVDRSGLMHGLDAFEVQAFDLIRGAARSAFDVTLEDPRTRDKYGPGLGEKMLVARRLCEAGAGFVTVHFGGWDMHGSIADGMNKVGPAVDRAVRAFVDDVELRLTTKEFDLLALLAADSGTVVSRDRILREVWSTDWYGSSKTVDVHVSTLRQKLGDRRWIETVRGVGLRLAPQP